MKEITSFIVFGAFLGLGLSYLVRGSAEVLIASVLILALLVAVLWSVGNHPGVLGVKIVAVTISGGVLIGIWVGYLIL